MASDQYLERINQARYMHEHALDVPAPDGRHWGDGLGIVKVMPWLRDLVRLHGAKTMLEVGAGRGQQLEPRIWGAGTGEEMHGTMAQWLGLDHYHMYDPAIAGIDQWPDGEFDCVVSVCVINSVPDSDFEWWLRELSRRTKKFCFLCGSIGYGLRPSLRMDSMSMDPVLLQHHTDIATMSMVRDEAFYLNVLRQHWHGAPVYFLGSADLPVTAGWHDQALVSP